MRWKTIRHAALLGAAAGLLGAGGAARAATLYQLENHPGTQPAATADGPFGMRLDDASGLNTFDFENNGAGVVFEITGSDTASIHGVVYHNQSGQLWQITANLSGVLTTNVDDGGVEPWYDPSLANTLYDGVLDDLMLYGDSVYGDGGANLKSLDFEADRLAFSVNALTLEFLGDPSLADFDPDGDADGRVELVGYPMVPGMVPMVVAKGHALDATTDQLAGLGWLIDEGETQPEYLRDLIFTFGAPIPEPSASLLFATGALLCGAALRRRRA